MKILFKCNELVNVALHKISDPIDKYLWSPLKSFIANILNIRLVEQRTEKD